MKIVLIGGKVTQLSKSRGTETFDSVDLIERVVELKPKVKVSVPLANIHQLRSWSLLRIREMQGV